MQKLISKKWLVRHLLVIVVAAILINLGFWQLRRLDEKRTRNNNILATLRQPPVTLTGSPADPSSLQLRRVQATGTFDNAQSMVLRNKSLNDQPGVHLLTPLRLDGSNIAVLVDRGWLPLPLAAPEIRAAYALTGSVTVEGIAWQTQTRPGSLSPLDKVPAGQPRLDEWFRVDIDLIQPQLPYPLLPLFIAQTPLAGSRPDELPRPAGAVILDEGPHLSYAGQWFSFAAALVILYAFFIRQELKKETGSA